MWSLLHHKATPDVKTCAFALTLPWCETLDLLVVREPQKEARVEGLSYSF